MKAKHELLERSAAESVYASYGIALIAAWRSLSGVLALFTPGLARRRRVVAASCRALLHLAGIRIDVVGGRHLDAGRCLVVANHQGMLSGIALMAVVPDTFFFTAKREFAERWLPAVFLRRLGVQFVERRDARAAALDLGAVRARLRSGESAVVFPEGTFRRQPGLGPFRMGGFVVAAQTATPVVPVAIRGARAIWPGKTWWPRLRRGVVTVRFLPPLAPAGATWWNAVSLRHECRERIAPFTGEFASPHGVTSRSHLTGSLRRGSPAASTGDSA